MRLKRFNTVCMKYVVFEQEKTGLKMPVLFPDHITHSSVKIEGTKVVSAVFLSNRTGRNGIGWNWKKR